jgi:hypothetical protein
MSRKATARLLVIQLGAALLLAGLLAIPGVRRGEARCVAMDDWQIEDLVAHLQSKGVELRAVPTFPKGSVNNGAYLTTTDKPWAELNVLSTATNRIETWQGTVSCHHLRRLPAGHIYVELWDDNGLCIGPFIFFGDPELRARILAALAT